MIQIVPISIFKDNYVWTLIDNDQQNAIIVDPGEAEAVSAFLKQRQLNLVAILITHHHWDHTNGIKQLASAAKQGVFGPTHENISGMTHALKANDRIRLKNFPIEFQIIEIPGHTKGHIAFHFSNGVFCGDTLFAAGCGRLFEGTAEQMFNSLQKLSALGESTQIYCAHEYTLNNLRFAKIVEPSNDNIKKRYDQAAICRQKKMPTLPSTLQLEKETNPFLRCHVLDVIANVERFANRKLHDPIEVFTWLRRWKDEF